MVKGLQKFNGSIQGSRAGIALKRIETECTVLIPEAKFRIQRAKHRAGDRVRKGKERKGKHKWIKSTCKAWSVVRLTCCDYSVTVNVVGLGIYRGLNAEMRCSWCDSAVNLEACYKAIPSYPGSLFISSQTKVVINTIYQARVSYCRYYHVLNKRGSVCSIWPNMNTFTGSRMAYFYNWGANYYIRSLQM